MGLNVPSFLKAPNILEPAIYGQKVAGVLPAAMWLTNVVMDWRMMASRPAECVTMAFKCSALILSGPGAVPFLKDLMLFRTWAVEKELGGVVSVC